MSEVKGNVKKLKPKKREFKTQRDIALDFAAAAHKKFDAIIKATILFGSQAKNTATPGSDIDIVVIVDDASINWDLELVAWYREELAKLIAAQRYEEDIHVTTIKLTTWWQDLLQGDPVVLNMLRYGEALIDIAGFFKPLKALLIQGKIHSTNEAVYEALQRTPHHLARSQAAELSAIEGVYWAMVDAAQAALMTSGVIPPSPEHIPENLHQTFVARQLLKNDFVQWYRQLFDLHKSIVHGTTTNIKGAEIDLWQERAQHFVKEMARLVDTMVTTKNTKLH